MIHKPIDTGRLLRHKGVNIHLKFIFDTLACPVNNRIQYHTVGTPNISNRTYRRKKDKLNIEKIDFILNNVKLNEKVQK